MAKSRIGLPREVAPGIYWIGMCNEADAGGSMFHLHSSSFVITGETHTLLFDTSPSPHWTTIERHLDAVLRTRSLDWIVSSHPEPAHAGNLPHLLRKYPGARVLGEVRDYHLFFPEFEDRFVPGNAGLEIDLGGDYKFRLLEGIIKDLPGTQWGYEASQQVLFVADAFAYTHHPPVSGLEEYPVHLAGECALKSSELPLAPTVDQAAFITKAALFWTRYVRVDPFLQKLSALLEQYPARLIAPSHGAVIDTLEDILPIIYEAHVLAYQGAV